MTAILKLSFIQNNWSITRHSCVAIVNYISSRSTLKLERGGGAESSQLQTRTYCVWNKLGWQSSHKTQCTAHHKYIKVIVRWTNEILYKYFTFLFLIHVLRKNDEIIHLFHKKLFVIFSVSYCYGIHQSLKTTYLISFHY